MLVASTLAVALNGLDGHLITVEASLSSQLPGIAIIGLPDASLTEAKQRIRVACQNSAVTLSSRFITINLSPAELPKNGSAFDLAMAMSALVASGEIPAERVRNVVHIGELGLDGSIRRTRGTLAMVQVAQRAGIRCAVVPRESMAEAKLVSGIEVVGVSSLAEAAIVYGARNAQSGWISQPADDSAVAEPELLGPLRDASQPSVLEPDMSDVLGQQQAVEALMIAASGGHHTSLVGPPGTGKTMLASRLSTILPDLNDAEALQTTAIASLTGTRKIDGLIRRPPFENPHHSATAAAMIGTGARVVQPGAITRASNGILFLDEAPEFTSSVLDSLRQPLETGTITLQRARLAVTLPARFLLVLAANPCSCAADRVGSGQCTCSGAVRKRYGDRISGPLRDRIDLRLTLHRAPSALIQRSTTASRQNRSSELRKRVSAARACAAARLKGTPWQLNRDVPGVWLRHPDNRPASSVTEVLDDAYERGLMSLRGYDRALRVAWTIADLEHSQKLERTHVARALAFREGRTV